MSNSLNQIFLNDFHESIGAKFIPFSGYSMPINYSTGIINENLHTRKSVGLFDVSHMGQILINDSFENRNYLKKIIPLDFDNLKALSDMSQPINEQLFLRDAIAELPDPKKGSQTKNSLSVSIFEDLIIASKSFTGFSVGY